MEFVTLAHYFDRISENTSRIEITKLLAELYTASSDQEARIISYLALGTLRAPFYGNQFNLAEKSIIKVLTGLFPAVQFSRAAIQESGDLGLYIRTISWPYATSSITIEDLHERLVTIETIGGTGSQEEKAKFLADLLKQLDVISASYVIRIIIGTMRLGFSDMTIIDALSWFLTGNKSLHGAIEDAYSACADIGLIAYTVKKEGIAGIKQIHPIVGIPIRPAAAERAPNAAAIIEKIGASVAQPKLDGFRLQIHIDAQKPDSPIWFYSRNLQNMSLIFPDLVMAIKQLPVKNLIAEGEAIVYDADTGTFAPFQETVKRKRKHNIEEAAADLPLRLFIFDLLFIDGQNVMGLPHEQRRLLLVDLFKSVRHVHNIQLIQERETATILALEDYFNEQICEGLEGLVVKRPDAPYQPGKRNFNWIKLKRHEGGHLLDTIDAVVLGYYYGRGKRAEFGIGAFLVGIYNSALDKFQTIAKVGTGLKDADWIDLKKQCDQRAITEQPHNVLCAPELRPDIWVSPELVVVIQADEITKSPLHSAGKTAESSGFALRFPRFMGYSVDKTGTQSTGIKEVQELYQQQYR
jgi:DNA ligase 1